ncbi:MAG: ATP synthase F1 subunit delta [Bacillota bacterium]|nr:ATP synthase F1 subunit delta [Bacillota bacterium]
MAELVPGVYADALFHAALELEKLEEFRRSFEDLTHLITENPKLLDVLAAPTIARSEKDEIVRSMQFVDEFRNFLFVLLDKRRIGYLPEIKVEFDHLVRGHLGIETAYVSSVHPLSDAQRVALKARLKESTGLEIEMIETIDPSLVGGLKIRIGDKVMDGSVRRKLQKLLDQMTNAVVSG